MTIDELEYANFISQEYRRHVGRLEHLLERPLLDENGVLDINQFMDYGRFINARCPDVGQKVATLITQHLNAILDGMRKGFEEEMDKIKIVLPPEVNLEEFKNRSLKTNYYE